MYYCTKALSFLRQFLMLYSKDFINFPICLEGQSTDSMTYRGKVAGIQVYHTKNSNLTWLIANISWLPYHLQAHRQRYLSVIQIVPDTGRTVE